MIRYVFFSPPTLFTPPSLSLPSFRVDFLPFYLYIKYLLYICIYRWKSHKFGSVDGMIHLCLHRQLYFRSLFPNDSANLDFPHCCTARRRDFMFVFRLSVSQWVGNREHGNRSTSRKLRE